MGMIKLPNDSVIYFKNHIDEIFETGFLAEGQWNKKLSEFISQMTGAQNSIPTNSNGSGIVSLLMIYKNYFKRSRVLIQSNTMYGVKTMVPAGNCVLDGFIPCKLSTLMPGIEDIKRSIEGYNQAEKSKLIILLSHLGGIINPDIEKISQLCKEEDIILLEDCAHSFGATFNGKHSGLFGDAGVYSFYSTKAIPAGEGGVIVTKNTELGQLASDFSIYDRFKQKMEFGFNNRISEPQALLAYSVVREWESIVENKTQIANIYIEVCNKYGINYIAQNSEGHIGNYYKFVIYNENQRISEFLPKLVTKTSRIYDYSIGTPNNLAEFHDCLPVWYKQDESVTSKVVTEIEDCFK